MYITTHRPVPAAQSAGVTEHKYLRAAKLTPKKASITTIAERLGLSIATVSRALQDDAKVREATKIKVLQMASELSYEPNHMAAGLRRGKSKILGVVVPHISGYFFPTVVHGIEKMAREAGYHVMLCQSNENAEQEEENINLLLNTQVEGLLVSISNTTEQVRHFEKVQKRGVPLVFFDRMPDMPDASAVVLDDHQGAFEVVQHLIAQGSTRIAHFQCRQQLNIDRNRHQGYRDALKAAGLPYDPALVCTLPDPTKDAGAEAIRYLLELAQPPDAVFSAYDLPAMGALEVLRDRHIKVPEQVVLSGFSNEPFTTLVQPQITSVEQRGEQMGETAVRLLLQMLKRTGNFRPQRILIKPQVMIRDSSLRVPL
jgi:LacI family transcriptional regulator